MFESAELPVGKILNEQIELLAWLSALIQEKITREKTLEKAPESKSERKVLILLESEDVVLASLYSSNLAVHFRLKPENIVVATPLSIPESLEDFDVLILDINSQQSPCLLLIESLEFEGNIVIFADSSMPEAIRARLFNQVNDLLIKPISWNELIYKPYFS